MEPAADHRPAPARHAGETQPPVAALGNTALRYLRRVFASHAGPDKTWTRSQAKTFIHSVQDHDDSTPAAVRLLAQPHTDLDGFLAYMASADSAITLPWKPCDLSWPLASYFISSSHNTYLTGNQLSSSSTTRAYTSALLRGCRCVEVDVWNGDESDVDSSASSLSDAQGHAPDKSSTASPRPKHRLGLLKERLPESLAARLDKTSLGKRMDGSHAEKHGLAAATGDPGPAAAPEAAEEQEQEQPQEPQVAVAEPRVLHGYTLTTDVPFRHVCNAIRESAFAVTDLPLIISLEVHCSPPQQALMVSIMEEAWRGLLVAAPETGAASLPSPHDLRGKILVKVKHAPPADTAPGEPESGDDDASPVPAPKPKKKPAKIIQELSRLGVYTQAVSFKAWTQPEATMPTHIFSLSESKFLDYKHRNDMRLFAHNTRFLMRTYPSGLRIGSSNLNPLVFWGGGAQVVALNWQQTDEGTMLNEAMFAGTGGYVLKPQGYRPHLASRPGQSTPAHHRTLSLAITFLAAQAIPLPQSDTSDKHFHPYIKTELHVDGSYHLSPVNDGRGHEVEFKARTRTHHGCDVDLGGERVAFSGVAGLVEELTFVRFTVRDDEIGRDDLAAWACVRLDRLGQGYRLIHLADAKGAPTQGVVLVKVEKTLT